jgi:CMP-N,N'-diacetyllegionaminic acid synthase
MSLNGSRVLALIPARSGSKGLPGKNWKSFCGKPLVEWTISQALNSEIIDNVIVSTDSVEVKDICSDYSVELEERSEELSRDDTPIADVITNILDHRVDKKYDYIILLQPTSPLRTTKHIDESLRECLKNKDAKSLVSVTQVPAWMSPEFCKKIDNQGMLRDIKKSERISNRQEIIEKYFYPNGAIYVSRVDSYLKHRTFYQNSIIPFKMDKWQSIDIDDISDFICAEAIMKNIDLRKLKGNA